MGKTRIPFRYGVNPHQAPAHAEPILDRSPIEVLRGSPSMINVLDALGSWQLVREAREALGLPAAASFKHCSPAGAAVAVPLSDELASAYEVAGRDLSPQATAYVRARGADPKCSFGDFVALSDTVDVATAEILGGVVSDGIVAPGYEPRALEILGAKKRGSFLVLQVAPDFEPPERESRDMFGLRLEQPRNALAITRATLATVVCGKLSEGAERDLVLGLIALKYTQSNSVGYVQGGQMIGIGAGQQSRVDCTKLAGAKADVWWLARHPRVRALGFRRGVKRQDRINWRIRFIEGDLTPHEARDLAEVLDTPAAPLSDEERRVWIAQQTDVSLVSDGYLPFRDNVDHAARHGVRFIAQPGGSVRDDDIARACEEHGIAMVHTGVRLFHH
jgi:phosphoribosylaminoimidazolecarboxamide formyltransferase/IMP cyclohydrolase